MTKIFIDANVIIAVLNKEYPLFRFAARVLSLSNQPAFELYTSSTCLAIAFYFSSKKSGEKAALEKIRKLCEEIRITNCGADEVKATLSNKQIQDFEDGMQYYSAVHTGCNILVTENQPDFHFSSLPVLNCETLLREVALPIVLQRST
ncbi:MAG TPA: PIN domain-containing protein [Phnomibacter sp.]|nr:PIN domain-containing protein [Phnomibacter sp.]